VTPSIGLVVLSLSLSLTNLIGNAQLPQHARLAPISVRACSISAPKAGALIWIAFVNRWSVTASDVRFEVSLSKRPPFEVVVHGRFSPGVHIEHAFRPPGGAALAAAQTISCAASYVRFENGKAWGLANIAS
jgi:hypothetical protein